MPGTPFQSLHSVLNAIHEHDGWRSRRQLQRLLAQWPELVGPAVAAQTRPTSIQRQILYVATSSSVWANNLTFERPRILAKLNQQMALMLTDIRFSTAHWEHTLRNNLVDESSEAATTWRDHPSRIEQIPGILSGNPASETQDAATAFQEWSKRIQARSQHLPLCPTCHCPTPAGEIKRWSVCALCATKRWSFSSQISQD